MAILVVGALSIPAVLVPEWILGVFIHEPSTLALAKNPLRMVAAFLFLDAVGMVLMNALLGVGDTTRVMLIGTGFQWLIFLPAVYVIGPLMGLGLVAVFAAQVLYRGLQSLTFALIWKRGAWQSISFQ
jgi:Na+-driven multidrug efflux pump